MSPVDRPPGTGRRRRGPLARAIILGLAGLAAVAISAAASAQDELRAGTGKGLPGRWAEVPLTVRDLGGTLLDEGDGPGLEIQGFALRIEYPAAAVTSCDFLQAGVTRAKPTLIGSTGRGSGYCYVLFAFQETTAPLTFRLGRPAPGDLVGNFRLGLAADLAVGTGFTVTTVPANALLDNGQGTLSESTTNGHLALVDGLVQVTAEIFRDAFEDGGIGDWSETRGAV